MPEFMYNVKRFKSAVKTQLKSNHTVNIAKSANNVILKIKCGALKTEWVITKDKLCIDSYYKIFNELLNQAKKDNSNG